MDAAKFRLAGYLAVAVAIAAGGGYGWARTVHMPAIVEIGTTACGIPPSSPRFGVPLQTILEAAHGLPFGVGPVEVPEGGGPVSLRFEPSVDGQALNLRLRDDTLYLPTGFGQSHRPPRRITIHCREGVIGSVRYQGDGGEGATFNVTREATAGRAWGAFDPPPAADPSLLLPTIN
jgi:hypothetical protein